MLITTEKAKSKTVRKTTSVTDSHRPEPLASEKAGKKRQVTSTAVKKRTGQVASPTIKIKTPYKKEDATDLRDDYWKALWVSHL